MIRPVTCVCLLLAGGSGLALYQAKHRAQLLDREIMRTIRTTGLAQERIEVLRAEWALLNEPERLAELSHHHLGLRTLSPHQFVPASELAARLPAPLPPDLVPPMDDDSALPADPEAIAFAHALPLPPAVAPRPAPAAGPVAAVRAAPSLPAPRALAPVMSAYATPMTAAPVSRAPMVQRVALPAAPAYPARETTARPAPAAGYQQRTPAPAVASSLGSAGGSRPALAPPVPYAPEASFPR